MHCVASVHELRTDAARSHLSTHLRPSAKVLSDCRYKMTRKAQGITSSTMFAHHATVVTASDVATEDPSTKPTGSARRACAAARRDAPLAGGALPPTKAPQAESAAQSARVARATGRSKLRRAKAMVCCEARVSPPSVWWACA